MRNLWGGRRSATWMTGVAGAVVLLVGTSGCAAKPAPAPTSSASSSPTPAAPVFASDEEALAAATEAYANYVKVSDEILMDGGAAPERIDDYTSDAMAESEKEGFADAMTRNIRSTGGSTFYNLTIQSFSSEPEADGPIVTAYVCSDVSKVDVLNSDGVSIVAPDRPDTTPFEVGFDLAPTGASRLVVASSDVWRGAGVCP